MTGIQLSILDYRPTDAAAPLVPSIDRARVRGQCLRILERLERGPTTNSEMIEVMHVYKYTSRISDLRELGYIIECTPLHDGVHEYRLVR